KTDNIQTAKIYLLKGDNLDEKLLEKIAEELLCNPITEEYRIIL
ncbi:MAG: phosphoribosylformylglycinamidine synthase subunit PurS, partial [Candidatus Aenigmarchaeota archaeon]|nr:phosphoribosylformylglycinamidine synthase subunit PurS [Candidatus Aenigmarchaeota archaeon]